MFRIARADIWSWMMLCLRTSVAVLRHDIGDVADVVGGDTSPSRFEG